MARTNNALVTYTDLTQMDIIAKVGTVPPSGNRCATKDFINTYYNVNTGASPYSGYAGNRLPRYQDILPDPNSFLLCYNLVISNQSTLGCYDPNIGTFVTNYFQTWTFTLVDQFGNTFYATSPITFTVQYDYTIYDDISGFTSGTSTKTVVIGIGQSTGTTSFVQPGTYDYQPCPMSSTCGLCYETNDNIFLLDVSPAMNGGCAYPTGTCNYTQTLFPGNFVSDPGSSTGYSWFWRAKNIGGTWENMTYSCFPDTSWRIFNIAGTTVYSGNNTTYVPWNGRVGNSGAQVAAGTYYGNIDLGDGSGVEFVKVVKLF